MTVVLDRRQTLALLGASAAVAAPGAAIGAGARDGAFLHGVASGDPAPDGAVIWTRVTPLDKLADQVGLTWEVLDAADGKVIRRGSAKARARRDFTAKVEVTGLSPDIEYSYRFRTAGGTVSPVGRFRTLSKGPLERLDLAVACCQLYQGGYFHAFTEIARLERLDAVIHLGDYIYEYGREYPVYGGAVADRIPEPPHETVTLADYRVRHAQAKRDTALQAAHARAAFICVWDDHELANNAYVSGASNHQPESEGPWAARKAAAMQAWFEWMPIREPRDPRLPEAAFRSFRFGDLAALFMLETRLLAREGIPRQLRGNPKAEDVPAGLAVLRDPSRDLLGRKQRRWLAEGLAASVNSGQPWQLVASQVVVAPVKGPDPALLLGEGPTKAMLDALSPEVRKRMQARIEGYRLGVPFNVDSWDGFPVAREALYRLFAESGSQPVVVSGDSHAFWANDLLDTEGRFIARELGVSAVSSPGYGDALPGLPLGKLISAQNPGVKFNDQAAKGFLKLTLQHDRADAEMMAVTDIKTKDYKAVSRRKFRCAPRGPLERA